MPVTRSTGREAETTRSDLPGQSAKYAHGEIQKAAEEESRAEGREELHRPVDDGDHVAAVWRAGEYSLVRPEPRDRGLRRVRESARARPVGVDPGLRGHRLRLRQPDRQPDEPDRVQALRHHRA